ncbi:protein PSK SIMULATOR 2-like [Telopea speciosissima]|uniref:protein PSK SIMULATOR 2-like n=1 Tax=Telopea speciosissima TaxID=54955 RepID=UPI001CC3F46A|nr:protein PSK SIMULATOR 2-like [Telopea speciosissima]
MGGICSAELSNSDEEDDSDYTEDRKRVKNSGKKTKDDLLFSDVDDNEMVQPKSDPAVLPLSFSGEPKPSPPARTASSKVPQMSSVLGKAGFVGLERAVEALDTLRSSVSNLNASTGFNSGMAFKKNKISILAFEVANTIVKGVTLLQSLSKGNIQFLKREILHSDGVQQLISTDLEELLSIAAADKREEFDVFSREVIRFGNLCKNPQWHNLGLYFLNLDSEISTRGQIKQEVEMTMQELETLALNTAELYHELHTLDRFEKDYQRKMEELESLHITQKGENLMILRSELKQQRKLVRSLEKKSLWSKNLEEVMGKLVDIVTFIHKEIMEAFGNKGTALISKDVIHKSERLGVCGLALHYANIISQIDRIVARPSSLPPNARDTLYHALPPSVKTVLRSQLQPFQAKEELTIAQIKDELEKILKWLVPVAANTNKAHKAFGWVGEWANNCSEFNKRTSAPNNPLRLQTLYHADREKTDLCIIELVTWLHRLISHVRPRDYGFKLHMPVRSPTRNALFLRTVTQRGSLQVLNNGQINTKALILQPETHQSSSPMHINSLHLQPETHRTSSTVNINGQPNSKVSLQLLQPKTQQVSSPVNEDGKTNSQVLPQLLQLESQQCFSKVHNYSETNIKNPHSQPERQQGSPPLMRNNSKINKAAKLSQEDRDLLEVKWRKLVPRIRKNHELGAGKKKGKQGLKPTRSNLSCPVNLVHHKTPRVPGLM